MDRPIHIPTRETVAFLSSHLAAGAELIEVGCGEGHVALALAQRGYRVTGLDSDAAIVDKARAQGAPVLAATWPDFESAPVDVIAFTRSLHHIGSLPQSIRRAHDLLKPGGKLLLEDFAFDQATAPTVRWFLKTLRSRPARLKPADEHWLFALLDADDPTTAWRDHHDHDLHTIEAMTRATAAHLTVREASSVPYLYRYLVPLLVPTAEAAAFIEDVLREEMRLGQRGAIALIGRRVAADR